MDMDYGFEERMGVEVLFKNCFNFDLISLSFIHQTTNDKGLILKRDHFAKITTELLNLYFLESSFITEWLNQVANIILNV